MAGKQNEILISAKFDTAGLKDSLRSFTAQLVKNLNDAFTGQTFDLSKAVAPVKIKLDLSEARTQFADFVQGLKINIPTNVSTRAGTGTLLDANGNVIAPSPATPKPTSGLSGVSRTSATSDIEVNLGTQLSQATAIREEIVGVGQALKAAGAVELFPQFPAIKSSITSTIRELNSFRDKEVATDVQGGPFKGLTDKDVERIQILGQTLNRARGELDQLKEAASGVAPKIKEIGEASAFSEGNLSKLGFTIGITGFGMSILGGQLQNLAQSFTSFITESAQATEPLERLQNLLSQDIENPDERSALEKRLLRIANFPGASLDSVTEGFRKLSNAGLDTATTIQLLEALTKSTGRAGSGAKGLSTVANQLAQSAAAEGLFAAGDVRSITQQGGKDLTEALRKGLGGIDAKTLTAAGFPAVVKSIIDGLKQVPEPLSATSDILNRINNSFTLMKETIDTILKPGLEGINTFFAGTLEPTVARIGEAFKTLSPDTQKNISNFILTIPAVAGVLGTVLTILGSLAVATATITQLTKLYALAFGELGVAGTRAGGILSSLPKFISIFITDILFAAESIGAFVTGLIGLGDAAEIVSTTIVGTGLKILGLTNPIGIAIQFLLAYATNLGHFRDLINGAIGSIISAFERLGSSLDKLFGGTGNGSKILSFLSLIIEAIGIVVELFVELAGGIIASVVNELGRLVDVFTSIVDVFNNFSPKTVLNSFTTLGTFFIGSFKDLGELSAAAFIDAFANIVDNGIPGINFASSLRDKAKSLRDDVFNNGGLVGNLGGELTKALDPANKLNQQLAESIKLAKDFDKSLADVELRFNKISTDANLRQLKFATEQSNAKELQGLEDLIKADPRNASSTITSTLAASTKRQLQDVRREVATEIPLIGEELTTGINNLLDLNATGFFSGSTAFWDLVQSLHQVRDLAKSGQTDFTAYGSAIDTARASAQKLRDIISKGVFTDDQNKQIADLKAELASTDQRVLGLLGTLDKRKQGEDAIIQKQNEEQIRLTKEAEQRKRELDALARTSPLKDQAEALNTALEKQNQLLEDIKSSGNDSAVLAAQQGITALKIQQVQLDTQIATVGLTQPDAVKQAQIAEENRLKTIQTQNQATRDRLQLLRDIAKENESVFKNALAGVNDLIDKFATLRGERADLILPSSKGRLDQTLASSTFQGLSSIATSGASAITSITNAFTTDVADKFIDKINSLQSKTANLFQFAKNSFENQFFDEIEAFGDAINVALIDVNDGVTKNAIALSKANQDLTKDPTNQTLLENTRELEAEREKLLKQGRALAEAEELIKNTTETEIQVQQNRIKSQQFENNLKIIEIKLTQQLFSLQQELFEKRIDAEKNRVSRGAIPNIIGLNNDVSQDAAFKAQELKATFDKENLDRENEVLELKAKQLVNTKADSGEIQKHLDYLDKEKKLKKDIYNLDVQTLNADVLQTQIDNTKTALQNFGDNSFNKVGDDFARMIGKIKDSAGQGISAMQTFKDFASFAASSFATAFTQAFTQLLTEGGSFTAGFGKFLGQLLITLGQALLQMGIAALAIGLIRFLFGDVEAPALGTAAAVAASAAGIGLIALGSALGGGSAGSTAASNSANISAGATGTNSAGTYDPLKDPKLIYQQGLQQEVRVYLETDQEMMIKRLVRTVNRDSRLANVIGNRSTNFVV